MTNLSVENVYTRQAAKELAKKYFWKLLGMIAIAFVLPYVFSLVVSTLLALSQNQTVIIVGSLVVMLGVMLLESGLMLGLIDSMICICRGTLHVPVSNVFSMMRYSLKGFGLNLWVSLKVLLWALPGYALVFVLAFFAASANSGMSEGLQVFITVLPALALIFGLVIPAALRYMLSTYILADKPATSVFDCVNQSKAMMKGHKWQAFKLPIPFILIMYLVLIALGLVFTLLNAPFRSSAMTLVLSILMVIAMLGLMAYFMVRISLCLVLFYLKRDGSLEPKTAEEAPADDATL